MVGDCKENARGARADHRADRVRLCEVVDHLGEAEVDELEVAVLVKQKVLELEVTMGDLARAEKAEGARDLCDVPETTQRPRERGRERERMRARGGTESMIPRREREGGGGKGERRSEVRGAERTYMAVVLSSSRLFFWRYVKSSPPWARPSSK